MSATRLLDFPVVDAHFHLWDRAANGYPWLAPGSPRPALGDHAALMRSFTLADHRADVGAWLDVVAGVHVEAGCADPLAESRWVAGRCAAAGFPAVHVARVDLTAPDAGPRVDALAAVPGVRGVRMRLNADPRIAGRAGIADEPVFRQGFAAVARHGLSFALSLYPPQAGEGVRLARDFPETAFVVDHLGWPRIGEGLDTAEDWRRAMTAFAACPNVTLKLSMLWPIDRAWRRAAIEPFVLEALSVFGPDRVMFGSNYPVETVMGETGDQLATLVDILGGVGRAGLEAVFRGTAARVFGLALPEARP